jgi:diketogulonate reductase-like aldo/keto reductase
MTAPPLPAEPRARGAMPTLGLGTWRFGEQASHRRGEVAALRAGLDLGYRLIDTAEMYGDGGAEEVVGLALAEALRSGTRREELTLVSKVLPQHASRAGVLQACERSLRRLRVEAIDLYLLHWRGSVPLGETVRGLEALRRRGWIRQWGVSNFDVSDLEELVALTDGAHCSANQVYYSLSARGIEFDLLPWQRACGMPLRAYSPIDQGALAGHEALRRVAERHAATAAQVALAWVLRQPGVVALAKAGRVEHLQHNWAARALTLGPADLVELDGIFTPPGSKVPLAMT